MKKLVMSAKNSYLPFCIIFLIALLLRLGLSYSINFPINDGGMFYQVILDIEANQFHLPFETTYNKSNIPLAYPPLSFYIAAAAHTLLPIDLLGILRFLPGLISTLTLPVFYVFAQNIFTKRHLALIATLFFAITPGVYKWTIMGGGLTRSTGFLFALLSLFALTQIMKKQNSKNIIFFSLSIALTMLSHPEMFLFTIISSFILIYFLKTSTGNFFNLCIYVITAITIAITLASPWWIHILQIHGTQPFRSALHSGHYTPQAIATSFLSILLMTGTGELFITVTAVFAFIGVLISLQKQNYLWTSWLIGIFIALPRSFHTFTNIPIAFLATYSVEQLLLPYIKSIKKVTYPTIYIAALLITIYSISLLYALPANHTLQLSQDNRQAFDWIRKETSNDDSFLVISPFLKNWSTDVVSEWFPALTKRTSTATVQGSEWLEENNYESRSVVSRKIFNCAYDPICIKQLTFTEQNLQADYIYVNSNQFTGDWSHYGFDEVYANNSVTIYAFPK